tara:strand:- start:917 stop:1126 length:210 start_codon:yes stop_codon:yes gene_type:complete
LTQIRKLFFGICFSALISTATAQFYSDLQQITFSDKRSGEGYFSGDNSKLVFNRKMLMEILFTKSTPLI